MLGVSACDVRQRLGGDFLGFGAWLWRKSSIWKKGFLNPVFCFLAGGKKSVAFKPRQRRQRSKDFFGVSLSRLVPRTV
jgi:hypothetical protein